MSESSSVTKMGIGLLSTEQQENLRQFKIRTRIDNEKYLSSHPEVGILISDFFRGVLLKRPTNILEFAADHFTNPNLHTTLAPKMEENSGME
ncbi:RIIa domain-containing protein 1 [Pholidichthys leucotaenia]